MIENLICWHDNKWIALKHVNVSILDFGFIHNDATYDVMKTSNGKILFYDKHVKRYENSCEFFGFTPVDNIDSIVEELLQINKIEDAFVWVCNWRGKPPSGSPRDMSGPEHMVVYVKPYYNIADSAVDLGLYREYCRTPDTTIPQKYKNFGWVELTKAQKYADDNDFDSAIILDTNGNVTEGPGFGICFVKNGEVYTPQSNCLDSITIQVVEDLCNNLNIQFNRADISVQDMYNSDEAFICSTSGGITPVNQIEHKTYKNDLTTILVEEFKNHASKN